MKDKEVLPIGEGSGSQAERPFEWDNFSDQPRIILDKRFKRRMRARHWPDQLKMFLTAGLVLPAAMIGMTLGGVFRSGGRQSGLEPNPERFFGMGVSLEKGDVQFDLIRELGVREVLVRLPLWDIKQLALYRTFIETWRNQGCGVTLNLLQDPYSIGKRGLLAEQARQVFRALGPLARRIQVGNAINRAKWGFYSVGEYLDFYRVFQEQRDALVPEMELLGPSVIDFEYHHAARALFNKESLLFDRVSALLYVDRCGSPANRQFGVFDTKRKIGLLYTLACMSPRVNEPGLVITEVNWPLQGTAPYAPTSETECVSEEQYSNYMAQYYSVAMDSGMVDSVYWHQLIAPGYGLVDDRDGVIRPRPAFARYAQMIKEARVA